MSSEKDQSLPVKERRRSPSEVLKRGYSDEEIAHLYEFGRLALENGDVRRAETVLAGITQIAPEYSPAWLGMCCVQIINRDYEEALHSAKQALRLAPESVEAMLFLISCLITQHDYNSAGTYLGEVGERIEAGGVDHPNLVRFYRTQLARYQNRG